MKRVPCLKKGNSLYENSTCDYNFNVTIFIPEGVSNPLLGSLPSEDSTSSSVQLDEMYISAHEAAASVWEEICHNLSTDISTGLLSREILRRRQIAGMNEFSEAEEEPIWKKFLGQFKEPLILLLLASSLVSLLMRQFDDAVVITLAIVIVATVAFIQEMRTDKALEELKKQVPMYCMCLRDNQLKEYQARELVPGDIVYLNIGDRIPADIRLFEANDLTIDESSFTGETEPAIKHTSIVSAHIKSTSSSLPNIAYMGTFIRTGRGRGIVISIGEKSQFGELFKLMQEQEAPRTPLQKNMDELAKKLSIFSFGFIAIVFCLGLYQGIPLQKIFNIAVSLAVAAIPEGLPIVVTLTLCLGIRRMAKRSALVKGLHTVETLGCVTTVFSDKTGTLTKNEMTVTLVVTGEGDTCSVTGVGYSSEGKVVFEQGYSESAYEAVTKMLETGSICNNAIIQNGQLLGQPTEGAILAVARKHGIHNPKERYAILEEIPFKSETKMMALKIKNKKSGEVEWLMKGALEVVLQNCTQFCQKFSSVPFSNEKRQQVIKTAIELGRQGLRVVAVGRGTSFSDLTYLGLYGIKDPPREGVRSSVEILQETGVVVKMVTGDSKETAVAIANAVGLQTHQGTVYSGDQLDLVDEAVLATFVKEANVFYRVSPRHKLRIVRALQESGQIIGMTGDGVNDVVALKRADIGIAMGKMGSAVSKEAADLILNDDDFTTILAAIEEGKCIFHNISNFVQFQVSTSIVALSLIALSTLFGLPSPLNPMQILLINVIMDGPPALTLGMEPIDEDVKLQPPRDTKKHLVSPILIRNCLISAVVIITGTLWVFRSEMMDGVVTARDTTMTFSCFVLFDLFNAFSCRSSTKSILEIGFTTNWYLFIAMTATFGCLLCVVYLPFLQYIFQTQALHLSDWAYLLCLTSSVLLVSEIRKFLDRSVERRTGKHSGHSKKSRYSYSNGKSKYGKNGYFGLQSV